VLRYRTEDSSALAKTVNEIWEDVKESRDEARRLSTEIWRQIEDTREKMNNQQVALARSYHTKEEISRMLDDKLDPMLSMLRNIQNPAYSGPRRRETDPL
jgi:polyhydroxyalkanoate synthesis regulator phasin